MRLKTIRAELDKPCKSEHTQTLEVEPAMADDYTLMLKLDFE